MKQILITLIALFCMNQSMQAQTWNGSVSDVWTNPLNWTPNAVPIATSNVTLNATGFSPKLQGATTIGAFASTAGATLDFNGFALTVGGINAYTTINSATLVNTNAVTDIVLNINTGGAGYFSQLNSCTINDHITINVIGSDQFIEGSGLNIFNGNVIMNVNSSATVTTSQTAISQFNGNFNFNRLSAGTSNIFSSGATITGNVNIQNMVGGATNIGSTGTNTAIGGTVITNITNPISPSTFTMFRVKNATSGGTINVQNSLGLNIQSDTLKVTTLTVQGYEGNAYAYFISNKIDCINLTIEDDVAYGGGYESYIRQNTITGNTTVNIKGTNTFQEAQSAGQANAYIGNTVFNCQGSGSLYLCQGDKSTFTGNLTVNRTVSGYTRLFNAGATITGTAGTGNFVYNNSSSGAIDIGNLSNATTIAGTINMNVNLVAISGFSMHRLINQTTGGKVKIYNTTGFDIQNDSLKVDSLQVVGYRGNAYAYFFSNKIDGHLLLSDSASYTSGHQTYIRNNTITGGAVFTQYGANQFNEADVASSANTYNGNVSVNLNGTCTIYLSHVSKSTFNGNLTMGRTGAGYTRAFNAGATITGNFSFTKNSAGATDLGLLANKTTINGTINMNVTQTTGNLFSMHRIQNLTNGGSVAIANTQGFDIQQDSLLTNSFSVTGYSGSAHAYFYNNQITVTGALSLQDASTNNSTHQTYIRNNTINGNSTITSLGINTLNEADAGSSANTFNGNVNINMNGGATLYLSHGAKSTFNGNLSINRTVAGYTALFNFGAAITGNFSFTKNNAGASNLGNTAYKTTINGTINMNVTQTTANAFSMHRIQNLTNGGSVAIANTQGFDIQQDSLLTSSFSVTGYSGSAHAYFFNNQITGTFGLQDNVAYTSSHQTYIRNNTITGNSTITSLGTNTLNEADAGASANTFNGNVIYNLNGGATVYISHVAKSTYNGNLSINRTIAGFTKAFNAGATINGNFSYTKNASGGSEFGNTSNKTAITGTINMNVTQTTADNLELLWLVNNTTGGTIAVQDTRAFTIQKDTLKVTAMSINGYGGSAHTYFNDNNIEGNFTSSDAASYTSTHQSYFRNNTISGNTNITINGTNTFNDGDAGNSGNTYLGNVTYNRIGGGVMNIGIVDTNSYGGNLVFNNATALPITAELIKFIGSTNTNIDQLGTGSITIQKFILNKTGSARVTLNKPVLISTSCAFLTGYINSTSSNPLIFPDNINHNSASDNSHVIGCVTKAGNDIFTFPLGNGIGYHPLAITTPAAITDSFQACIILKHPSDDGYNVNSKDAALLQIAPYHYWTLNQIFGTNSETVSLGWSIPCANTIITSLPAMAVARWNGTQWNNLGNAATTGTISLGTVSMTGTTANYGVFALGTISASNSWQITSVTASASTVCAGTSTTLSGVGASTYNWQPGNLSGTSVVVTPLTTTTYTVTGTSATGCITTATKTIVVNPVPTPNAGTDRTHTCITPSTTIGTAGVAGTTYAWLPATGLTASNIAQPVANPVSTTTYTVTATITATGCTATDAVIVTVNKTAPTANAGADKTNTCTTPSQTIGTAAVTGNTYSWSPSLGLSASNIAQPTANPASTSTYTVTVTNTINGCTSTDAVIVTVNKTAPTANAGADVTTTCTTPSQTIGTATIAGNTYAWSPAAGLSATNIAQPIANPTTTSTYTVTVTNTINGCTATDAVIVTVNKTAPTANAGTDKTTTCTTPSQIIGTATVAGNTYVWSPAAGLSATNIAQPTANPASTSTYTVTVTNTVNGCTATDAVVVTVNKTPPTANAGADVTTTCTTPSQTIGTASVVGNTYSWSAAAGLSATNIAQPSANPASTTTYTVTVTNTANGCTSTDAVIVNVNKTPPTANAGTDKITTCTTPSQTIGTALVAGNTYAWNPAAGLSATNIAQPSANPAATTTYTVTVTTTANGCTSTDAVLVTVNKTPPTVGTTTTAATVCAGTPTSITGTGANTYAWMPGSLSGTSVTVSPTTTTTYTVTGTSTSNGCTATATRTITVNCSAMNLTLFIEGFYIAPSTMEPVLNNQGVSGSTTITDTITVNLRNTTAPHAIVRTVKTILNTNGTATCAFTPFVTGTYYVEVLHRNAIKTWSSTGVAVGTTPATYNFSNAITKAFGSNMVLVSTSPNVYAFYSGDINQDENIDLIDQGILDLGIAGFDFGYKATDLNGDGNVDILDTPILETNVNNFIFSIHL